MKRLLPILLFALVFTSFKAYSQVPNAGFETWTNAGTYMDPQNWTTPNSYTSFIGITVVSRSNDKRSGQYAIQMQTKNSPFGIIPGAAVSGTGAVLNTTNNTVENGGFPFTNRPANLDGFYKYTPVNGDTAGVFVALYKWNATTMQRDTIAMGIFFTNATASAYTPFTAQLFYQSGATPDTAEIIMSSSSLDNPQVNSTLIVDDLAFSGVASVKDDLNTAVFAAYPNPCTDVLTVKATQEIQKNLHVKLIDLSGKLIMDRTFNAGQENYQLHVGSLPAGLYLLQVQQDEAAPETVKIRIDN